MGSSDHASLWTALAAVCGFLYLIFDAGRYFAHQLSPVGLRRLAGDADENEQRSRWLRYDPDNFQLVSGSLLQIALVIAVVATALVFQEWPLITSAWIAVLIWIPIVIVWKLILILVPEGLSEIILRAIIPVSHFFYYAFWPALYPLRRVVARIDREADEASEDEEPTEEEVQAYIDVGEEEGILEPAEGKLLQSIVDFGDRLAREIMTPRIDVLAFDDSGSLEDLARLFSESKYSRIPIYRGSIDQIVGIVHIKEMFDAILRGEKTAPAEIARAPYVVSESKSVADLLREFQSEHIQVAVVVDEYGGTAGIVTIEDIVEEIVGDIADEHEEEEPTIVDLGDGSYLVSGLLRVDLLEEKLGAELAGDDYETVAGMIFTMLGRVPNAGALVKKNGFQFSVDRADRRRIYRVKVMRDPDWREEEDEES